MSEPDHLLDLALASALEKAEFYFGEPLASCVTAQVVTREAFWAELGLEDRIPMVRVASSTIHAISALVEMLLTSSLLEEGSGIRDKRFQDDDRLRNDLFRAALEWLVLHQLMHWRLGHLRLQQNARIVELEGTVRRKDLRFRYSELEGALSKSELLNMRFCLEIQADQDASEVQMAQLRHASCQEIRMSVAAACMNMMLMEQEGYRIGAARLTHPNCSIRIFQHLVQLTRFWACPPIRAKEQRHGSALHIDGMWDGSLPEPFQKDVLFPILFDLLVVAAATRSGSVVRVMSDAEAIVNDLSTVRIADDLSQCRFVTPVARKWAELRALNEKVIAATDWRYWNEPVM